MFKFLSKNDGNSAVASVAVAEAVAQVAPATPVEPVAETLKPTLVGEELDEYLLTARAIGFAPGALLEQRLLNFFVENGIAVYQAEKVGAYLDKKFGKATNYRKTWCWCPLRESDVGKMKHEVVSGENGSIEYRHYHKEVPLPALLTVQKISDAFPEVVFYVSDAATKGDPFVMAWAPGINQLIFERYDEPSFRM